MLGAVLDAGAEEVTDEGEAFEVITEASDMVAARTALQDAGIDYDSADAAFVPSLKVEVDAETARKVFRLIDALEDSDDVQNIYSNFDLTPEVQAELEAGTSRSPCECSASTQASRAAAWVSSCRAEPHGAARRRRRAAIARGARHPASARAHRRGSRRSSRSTGRRPSPSSACSPAATCRPSWAPPRSRASRC